MVAGNIRSGKSSSRGFALVVVIWGIGLLAVIAATVATTSRYNVLATANTVENARAEALADGLVNIVVADLINNLYTSREDASPRFGIDGTVVSCRLNEDAIGQVIVVDEGATKRPPLLESMEATILGFCCCYVVVRRPLQQGL